MQAHFENVQVEANPTTGVSQWCSIDPLPYRHERGIGDAQAETPRGRARLAHTSGCGVGLFFGGNVRGNSERR